MRIAVVQPDPTVGAFQDNLGHMLDSVEELAAQECPPDLVVFAYGALTGFPLQGLAWSRAFSTASLDAAVEFAQASPLPALISAIAPLYCQFPDEPEEEPEFLSGVPEVFYCEDGDLIPLGFADEEVEAVTLEIASRQVTVVLDRFLEEGEAYADSDVIVEMMALSFTGASSLPVSEGLQRAMMGDAARSDAWVVFANLVGGQEEDVFSGGSFVMTPYGEMVAGGLCFQEAIFDAELTFGDDPIVSGDVSDETWSEDEALWCAASLALRDYVHKNGFQDVVIGLSGGLDSAAVAVLAVDTFGSEHTHLVTLPGPYTSEGTLADSKVLALSLGCTLEVLPIQSAFEACLDTFGEAKDLTQQNLQARLRMVYLMAFSNEKGWMMLNTGNRSEQATGYSTLYGDTTGSFSPFGAVYKTRLIQLLKWRDSQEKVVPQGIFDRPPSAELRPDQKDSDSLPPYEVLDGILNLYLDEEMTLDEICEAGYDPQVVDQVIRLVAGAEFKRRQEPLSPTFGALSLVKDRDWPTCNRFRG